MNKLYIRTNANNAEKTIERAIKSVLNQSYHDFLYYINDNGSSDNTRKIIEKYAAIDSRIVPFYNKINRVYNDEYIRKNFYELTENIDNDDFMCYLDADDEYYPTFLEEVLQFMMENNLDIGICSSEMLSVKDNNAIVGVRQLPQNLILQGKDFIDMFPVYHQFARTVWGKIYRGHTLKGRVLYNTNDNTYPNYGSDTIETLRAFSKSHKVGILAKILHKYYISNVSDSYRFDPSRVVSDQIQHRLTIEYLEKLGAMKHSNLDTLYIIYCNAIRDTINVALKSNTNDTVKLKALSDIITCPITSEMLSCKAVENSSKEYVLKQISEWIAKKNDNSDACKAIIVTLLRLYLEGYLSELPDEFYYELIEKSPILIPPFLLNKSETVLKILNTSYISSKKANEDLSLLEILLMDKLKKEIKDIFERCCSYLNNFPDSKYSEKVKEKISTITDPIPILRNFNLNFITEFVTIVANIIDNNYFDAFELTVNTMENKDALKGYDIQFYCLGQNLACFINYQPGFIYFKKLIINYWIENGQFDKARAELSDFDILLPEDEDFLEFRNFLEGLGTIV